MRRILLFFCLVPFSFYCFGQHTSQLNQCKEILAKDPDTILSPDICSVIVSGLASNEEVASVFDSGSFMTLTPDGILHEKHLPAAVQSSLVLKSLTRTVQNAEVLADQHPKNMTAALLPGALEYWAQVRDTFCSYHPGGFYSDLSGKEHVCQNTTITGSPNFPEEILNGVSVLQLNFQTARADLVLLSPTDAEAVQSAQSPNTTNTALPQAVPSDSGNPFMKIAEQTGGDSSASPSPRHGLHGPCQKAITFAFARGRQLTYAVPVSPKSLSKFRRKYPIVCFTQYAAGSGEHNYLVVLSSSASAFTGLQPAFRTSTTTAPVSGSGTLTDSSGETWQFAYEGTETATTTTQKNVPYTHTTSAFYANAYSEDGTLIASSERSTSSRQGGDPYNAAGYNITSALLSIHLKEHLVESIVKKVSSLP